MGPVRLSKYFGKVVKRKFVILALLALFCIVVVTNIYFICNMTVDLTFKQKIQETLEQQWHRRGLIFNKEAIQKALAAGHRNASDWAEQEILGEVKKLHINFYKPDFDSLNSLERRIKFDLLSNVPNNFSKESIAYAWLLASNWNDHLKNLTAVKIVLSTLCSSQIQYADISRSGTQLKLLLDLEGGQQALFKPQWYNRNEVIDGPVYAGRDRHNAEVAAFYLALILDMYRVPYIVGRRVNLRREIMPVASVGLLETFTQNASHTCFYGNCPSCNPSFTVCGGKHSEDSPGINEGDVLEGSLILMLPSYIHLKKFRHPWQRTYNNFSARWEVQVDYCDAVKRSKLYSPTGTRLLDLIDTCIFDFLIDNGDRHHYEIIENTSIETILLLDNGKGFGNPHRDHIDILAPLVQCCLLRSDTYRTLLSLRGKKLSELMNQAQKNSHIFPLLSKEHLAAMDRRLTLTFAAIQFCFRNYGETNVLKNLLP